MARKAGAWVFVDSTERDSFGAAQGVRPGDFCSLASDGTAYTWKGGVWSAVGGGGGAKQMLSWGGFISGTNQYPDAVSPASGGVVFGSRDEETTILAPFDGDITFANLMLQTGNTGQTWRIWIADVDTGTFTTPAATSFSRTAVGPWSANAGDKINIEYDAGGTTPGQSRIDLIFEES